MVLKFFLHSMVGLTCLLVSERYFISKHVHVCDLDGSNICRIFLYSHSIFPPWSGINFAFHFLLYILLCDFPLGIFLVGSCFYIFVSVVFDIGGWSCIGLSVEGQCICRETHQNSNTINFEEATCWWLGIDYSAE